MTKMTVNYGSKLPANNSDIVVDSMSPRGTMILLKKFKVEVEYFELIKSQFNEIFPYLLEGVEYTAEDLVGAELWAELLCFNQRHAHLCLTHLTTLPGARLKGASCMVRGTSGFRLANKEGEDHEI